MGVQFFEKAGLTGLLYEILTIKFHARVFGGVVSKNTMRIFFFFVIALVALLLTNANASCVCRCVNGRMQPLCNSVNDMPPFCPPSSLCPIAAPPTLAPLGQPIAPPVGTR